MDRIRKIMKRTGVLMVALSLVFSLMMAVSVQAASRPKLNKSSATISVGKTVQLKVKNADKSFKWSSDKKAVATVDSNGKVKGVAPGSCKITAKRGDTKLVCNITVDFSQSDAKKKIAIEYDQCDDCTIAIVKNKNSFAVDISADMVFYNDSGKMIDKSSDSNNCLSAGAVCVLRFSNPHDENYHSYRPDSYNMTYAVSSISSSVIDYSKNVAYTADMGNDAVVVAATNEGNKKISTISATVLMYDGAGNLIEADESYLGCEEAGHTSYDEFSYPYDWNVFERITPESFEVYINCAYTYSWMSD